MKYIKNSKDNLSEQSKVWLENYRKKNPKIKSLTLSGENMFKKIKRMRRLDHLKTTL